MVSSGGSVLRTSHSFFFAFALAVLAPNCAHPQDKPQDPKVVLNLEKPASTDNSPHLGKFGQTCDPFNQKFGEHGPPANQPMKPTSIAELMGAPIDVVKIRRYSPAWKNPDDVRNLITKLLKTQTGEVYVYEPWDEAVFSDIIATVQFSDHTEGTLEVSSVHVCFSNHSRSALWLRVFPPK
jgi:hypothetical protein